MNGILNELSQQDRQKMTLQNTLDADAALVESLRILYGDEDPVAALRAILRVIGELFHAERAYIFSLEGKMASANHKWSGPADRTTGMLDFKLIDRWHKIFLTHKCVFITDREALAATDPGEYAFLCNRGVERIVLVPLEVDGQLGGFIGVTNPVTEKLESCTSLLETLGYFITSSIQRFNDQQRLERLSYYDTLTGTHNRNAFIRDVEEFSATSDVPLGVLCVDVNGMKDINDRNGHAYGDQILLKATETIRGVFGQGNIYRMGGDEFTLLISGISEAEFERGAQALKNLLAAQDDFHLSVGYQWASSCGQVHRLAFLADEMMNDDKKAFYHRQAVPRRYRHVNDDVLGLTRPGVLARLLAEGQFVIYIQPKVEVDNRGLIGAEALIRLRGSDGSLMFPDQFIPLLEETRLISQVDFFVFEQVCRKIDQWLSEGKQVVPISVNFSRYSLTQKHFAKHLSEIWARYKTPQNLMEIEITESMNQDDGDTFLGVIKSVRDLGFTVSIDDFGVKYANLSLFTLLKFDVLKIDKILITDLQESETSQIVLQSVSDVCRKMGIHLVVEGVETEEQFAVLQELGCEGAQGYLFDRPIPMEAFVDKYLPQQTE